MDFLKTLLPWIGAAATGNIPALIEMAAVQVGKVVGAKVDPTAKGIMKAVQGASPEQMLEMQKADQEFASKMQAMGFAHAEELERIAAGDRDSARKREISTGDSLTPRILAAVAVIAFLVLIIQVMQGATVADGMRDAFMILLGAAIALVKDVYGYYFGSSVGSKDKTDALASAANR